MINFILTTMLKIDMCTFLNMFVVYSLKFHLVVTMFKRNRELGFWQEFFHTDDSTIVFSYREIFILMDKICECTVAQCFKQKL